MPFSIRAIIAGTYVLNVAIIRAIFEARCKCLVQTLNDRARDLRHVCRSLQINSEGQSGVRSEHRVSPDAFGGGRAYASRHPRKTVAIFRQEAYRSRRYTPHHGIRKIPPALFRLGPKVIDQHIICPTRERHSNVQNHRQNEASKISHMRHVP